MATTDAKHARRASPLRPGQRLSVPIARFRPSSPLPPSPSTAPHSAERVHRNDIQGLRAVAVLLVALDHAGVAALPGGYVGVDVFFVLSGFLITQLLLAAAHQTTVHPLIGFYARRARRILPAAALTLITTDIVAYSLLNFVRAKQVLQDSISASLFIANIHFAHADTNYFAQGQLPSPLQNFWSLGVEEQFYLVWPIILLIVVLGLSPLRRQSRLKSLNARRPTVHAIRRLTVVVTLLTLASLAWSINYTHSDQAASYFSTLSRAWELGLGAALAIAESRLTRLPSHWRAGLGWLGLAGIGVAAAKYSSTTPFPGSAALLPTVGAALVIASGIGSRHSRIGPRGVLSLPPLRYVGDRSYAFYLWHWPVLIIAEEYEGHSLPVTTNLLLLLGAFGLSILSYILFENPIRRRNWSPPQSALLLWPASVLVVVIVAAWGIGKIDVHETRLLATGAPQYPGARNFTSTPAPLAASSTVGDGALAPVVAAVKAVTSNSSLPTRLTPAITALLTDHYNYPKGCSAESGQSRSNICKLGDPTSSKTLVVMGDSHTQMWMPAILAMAKVDHWDVRPVGKSACTPAEWWHLTTATSDCKAWYPWAIREIKALRPDVTLISAAYPTYGGAGHISSLIEAIKPYTKHVAVLGELPPRTMQPVDCLLSRHASMGRCSLTETVADETADYTVQDAAKANGAAYINDVNWFCHDDVCPTVIGHTIVYMDKGHITATYATELSQVFRSAFRAAVDKPHKPATHQKS